MSNLPANWKMSNLPAVSANTEESSAAPTEAALYTLIYSIVGAADKNTMTLNDLYRSVATHFNMRKVDKKMIKDVLMEDILPKSQMKWKAEHVLILGSCPHFDLNTDNFRRVAILDYSVRRIHQNPNRFRDIANQIHRDHLDGTLDDDLNPLMCYDLLSRVSRFAQQCLDLGHLLRAYVEEQAVGDVGYHGKLHCLRLLHRCRMLVETGIRSSECDPRDPSADYGEEEFRRYRDIDHDQLTYEDQTDRAFLGYTGFSHDDLYKRLGLFSPPLGRRYILNGMEGLYSERCMQVCFDKPGMAEMWEHYRDVISRSGYLIRDLLKDIDKSHPCRHDMSRLYYFPWFFQDEVETLPVKLDTNKALQYLLLVSKDAEYLHVGGMDVELRFSRQEIKNVIEEVFEVDEWPLGTARPKEETLPVVNLRLEECIQHEIREYGKNRQLEKVLLLEDIRKYGAEIKKYGQGVALERLFHRNERLCNKREIATRRGNKRRRIHSGGEEP